MADISKIKTPDGTTYDIKDATARAQSGVTGVKGNSESSYRTGEVNLTPDNIGAVAKTTYEYNKERSFGGSGKLLIGKFPCYDTNVTIEINSTTSTTYHAVAVLATQNVNNSHGGTITWNVYGDDSNTVAPNLYLYYPTDSRWIEIYFSPTTWSKNLIHIQCIGLQANPTNICESVTAIPESATTKPTNVSNNAYAPKSTAVTNVALATNKITKTINGTTTDVVTAATTGAYGITKLSTSTSSTATDLAATPSAVKTAYDLANTANGTANTALSGVNGNLIYDQTFTISNGVATFTPHVYQKGAEVTSNYAKSCFAWKYRLIDGTEVDLPTLDTRGCSVTITDMGYGGHVVGIFTPA